MQLSSYQEQAYLLDPYLEILVTAVVVPFKTLVKSSDPNANEENLLYLSELLHRYVKFRGYKTISLS